MCDCAQYQSRFLCKRIEIDWVHSYAPMFVDVVTQASVAQPQQSEVLPNANEEAQEDVSQETQVGATDIILQQWSKKRVDRQLDGQGKR